MEVLKKNYREPLPLITSDLAGASSGKDQNASNHKSR